jgi:hypothetical protein
VGEEAVVSGRRRRLAWCAIAAALSAALLATPAHAGDTWGLAALPPKPQGLYLPVGINVGYAAHPSPGAVVGPEVSIVQFDNELHWFGAYADALWDTGWSVGRASIGPEVGVGMLGVDSGFMMQLDHGKATPGFVARPVLTVGWVAIYGRWGYLFDAHEAFGEIGLLVKYPVHFEQ